MRWRSLAQGSLALILTSTALAFPLQLVECPEVNLLGPACEVTEDDDAPPSPVPAPVAPLFTLQTMRPDTPPLLVQVYNDPTDANIDAYLDWEHRYLSQTLQADMRVKQRRQERKAKAVR